VRIEQRFKKYIYEEREFHELLQLPSDETVVFMTVFPEFTVETVVNE